MKTCFFSLIFLLMLGGFSSAAQNVRLEAEEDTLHFMNFITVQPSVNPGFGNAIIVYSSSDNKQPVQHKAMEDSFGITEQELDCFTEIIEKAINTSNQTVSNTEDCNYCGIKVYFHSIKPYRIVEIDGIKHVNVFFDEVVRNIKLDNSNLSVNSKKGLLTIFKR